MLSNNLISLSVRPIGHQRPCQLGCSSPRVLAALRHHWHHLHRCRHSSSCTSSRPVLIKNRIERSISKKYVKAKWLGTQGVRDFGMKVPGISFTISTLLVRAAQSVRAPFWFEGNQGRELGRGKMADGHGMAIPGPNQAKSVWGVGVYNIITIPIQNTLLPALVEEAALSMCNDERGTRLN